MPERIRINLTDVSPAGAKTSSIWRSRVCARTALAVLMLVSAAPDAGATRRAYRPSVGICGAAVRGRTTRIAELLSKDPSAVQFTDDGASALHWASGEGFEATVALLLERGAIADARAWDESTPLHWAALKDRARTVEILAPRYAEADVRDNRLRTPLFEACRGCARPEIVRLLLNSGANPNAKDDEGATPLQHLAFHGELEALRMLVESGADVNARGFRGATALHWAVDGRRFEIVRFLLDHGAAVSARDDDNRTPLQWCISEFKEARFGAVRRLKRIEVLLRERTVFTTGEP